MSDGPNWRGRPTRLPGGGWGVAIEHFPATQPPQPGDTVKVYARRRKNWTARITAVEDTRRQTVVHTTGPDEAVEHEDPLDAERVETVALPSGGTIETLREVAATLDAATATLRAARLDGEQTYLEVLSALYYAEDDQGCNLVEAHQVLGFSLPNRNASHHALHGAAKALEAATDTLFNAKDLLQDIRWLDDFGGVKAADSLRTAVARMDTAGLLEAAGDAIREAAVLLADPANPNSADLKQDRAELVTLRGICNALSRGLRNARQDGS